MEKTLQAIYIRLDLTSQSLSAISLSQLILKIIFSSLNPVDVASLKKEIKKVLGAEIGRNRIEESLEILWNEKKIQSENGQYYLSHGKRKEIDKTQEEFNNRILRIIDKYFGKSETDKETLIEWFQEVTIEFFTKYKTAWLAARSRNFKQKDQFPLLINLVTNITKKSKKILNQDKEWLIKQYVHFIHEDDEDVDSVIWDYGMCAFSASFITAATSADQLSIDTIRDSIFLLDTNILMYLNLEKGEFYNCYTSLEKAFKELNIKPAYLHITRDEYVRVMTHVSQGVYNIVNKYEKEVLLELEDEFVQTALHRECVNEDDFKRFFKDIMVPPDSFPGGLEITKHDDNDILEITASAMADEILITELNEIF